MEILTNEEAKRVLKLEGEISTESVEDAYNAQLSRLNNAKEVLTEYIAEEKAKFKAIKAIEKILTEFSDSTYYDELKGMINIAIEKYLTRVKKNSYNVTPENLEQFEMEVSELFAFHEKNVVLFNKIKTAFSFLPTDLFDTVKGSLSLQIVSKYTSIPEEIITSYLKFKNYRIDYDNKRVLDVTAYLNMLYEKLQKSGLLPKTMGEM